MNIIFMGTPDFSVGTLESLIQGGHNVVLVVTQPDKPKGRGGKMQMTPVKETALKYNIPVFQPKKIRAQESIEELKKYDADIMVVIAFGQIIPKAVLDIPKYGCVNIHASLLPKYRGAAPIQWAVIDGEEVTGVTTMQMDEGLDTGDMLQKAEVVLAKDETAESLHDKLSEAGAKLILETLKGIEEGTIVAEKQGETTTHYASMLTKEMGNIDWAKPAVEIERLIRGLNSWPCAYTDWNGKVMKIWKAELALQTSKAGVLPGTVTKVEKDGFTVQTGEGSLKIVELQIPGKKKMDAAAFLRGYEIKEGLLLKMCQ